MILAFDLGTGGAKICAFNEDGSLHLKTFKAYDTYYPADGFHEQNPRDWWKAVVEGTSELIAADQGLKGKVRSLAISGHSLAVVPLDASGELVFDRIPIWSDTRTGSQCKDFFNKVDYEDWYMNTGNGFSAECYSIFKIMWYRENNPSEYSRIKSILGSKDYINFLLTGNKATDYSYASGFGAYNLKNKEYIPEYLDAADIDVALLPASRASHEFVGNCTDDAIAALGLKGPVAVYCGGVDNSCMALGARNTTEGRAYLSLGSSAWIAVSSAEPLVDTSIKPFIFNHVVPGMYTSATSIFSAGSSLKWFREKMAFGLEARAADEERDIYDLITEEASKSAPGANGLIFNPTLAGTPAASAFPDITGAFLNIRLGTEFRDLCRAVLEGVTFELSSMWVKLNELCKLSDEIVIVGGGSRSVFWRQMFADIFGCNFSRISTDQDAAALGAAAIAAVGSGVWKDFTVIDDVIQEIEKVVPNKSVSAEYSAAYKYYSSTWKMLSEIGKLNAGV